MVKFAVCEMCHTPLHVTRAVFLHMGHRFLCISHCLIQTVWKSCPQAKVPRSSPSTYSSWEKATEIIRRQLGKKSTGLVRLNGTNTWQIQHGSCSIDTPSVPNECFCCLRCFKIVSSLNPVQTSPIRSSNARSSFNENCIWVQQVVRLLKFLQHIGSSYLIWHVINIKTHVPVPVMHIAARQNESLIKDRHPGQLKPNISNPTKWDLWYHLWSPWIDQWCIVNIIVISTSCTNRFAQGLDNQRAIRRG